MKRRLFSLLMVLILLTCVCCNKGNKTTDNLVNEGTPAEDKYTYQANFDVFTDDVFHYYVTKDSITLNYTLANPENYKITNYIPTFGNYTKDAMEEDMEILNDYLNTLLSFDRKQLSADQQITYDILKELFENELSAKDFYYIQEPLSPTTGLQAQLPVLLAEYHFYDEEDVKDYLKLLTCMDEYFNQICSFEQEKSEKGLFMSDACASDIISQCQRFIRNPEDNYLLSTFKERLDAMDIDPKQKQAYIEENASAVKNHVIPSYDKLISTLTSLKGSGTNEGGVCNYENGKAYYEYLVKSRVGTYRDIDEIQDLLNNYMSRALLNMQKISSADESVLESVASPNYRLTDPSEIIEYLKKAITDDFPSISPVNCTIKYVHESLEEYMSPAFYLTPPLDQYNNNMIYINKGAGNDMSAIFTTIAHEGYPGHLYQTVYYQQRYPSLIRSVIDFGGYSEGWATYVENYSYSLSGLDKNLSELLQNNLIATLCVYGNIDLGVNYYNWDKEKTSTYLKELGITDESSINSIYNAIVAEPCNYLKYIVGCLEIEEMKNKAKEALGYKFVLKDFHTFYLDMGPTQFNIMNTYLDQWIQERK